MRPKTNDTLEKEPKPGRVKIGKLRLNKETIKDLSNDELKKVDGGLVVLTIIGILIGPILPGSGNCVTQTCGCTHAECTQTR